MDRRYIWEDFVEREQLDDLASLVKHAWSMALIDPLLGDEIIADLCSDIQAIVSREKTHLEDEARKAATKEAQEFWHERDIRRRERVTERAAELAAASFKDGLNPHGYYVYFLWPSRDAEQPIYIGRSGSVLSRLGSHMSDREKRYGTAWVTLIDCKSEQMMIDTESMMIGRYKPVMNVIGTLA